MPLKLYSTFYFESDGCEELCEDAILSKIKYALNITILSAYYSISFLKLLFKTVVKSKRKECIVKLVFNGFAGNRLKKQKDELLELIKYLKKIGYSNIKIYLNTETALFHSKLYRFETKGKTIWFIGSANASEPAFNSNEEILLAIHGKQSRFEQYVEEVVDDSVEINKVREPKIENLISFWRTGLIYFKPNTQIQFTFNELNMDEDVKEILNNLDSRPRNTNPGTAWGAYNIKRALGLLGAGNDNDADNKKKSRVIASRWSVETCYGYWVPTKYSYLLDQSIFKAGSIKEDNIHKVIERLEDFGKDKLVADYRGYLDDVIGILEENEIDWRPDDDLPEKFDNFLSKVTSRLYNPKHIERASRPLISTDMPEIWSDSVATEDFSDTFFEYLEYKNRVPSNSLILFSLRQALKLKTNNDAETINDKLVKYLEKNGWSDNKWLDILQK